MWPSLKSMLLLQGIIAPTSNLQGRLIMMMMLLTWSSDLLESALPSNVLGIWLQRCLNGFDDGLGEGRVAPSAWFQRCLRRQWNLKRPSVSMQDAFEQEMRSNTKLCVAQLDRALRERRGAGANRESIEAAFRKEVGAGHCGIIERD